MDQFQISEMLQSEGLLFIHKSCHEKVITGYTLTFCITKPVDKKLKIMNFKNQEQILVENALRSVLSIMPNGHQYELNGNMRLINKNVE